MKNTWKMRTFSSYGPLDTDLHYYAPREELITTTFDHLVGSPPTKGGHYVTVWAPRQTGKTWLMQQIVKKIHHINTFEVGFITMQSGKSEMTDEGILNLFTQKLSDWFDKDFPRITKWNQLSGLFTKKYFTHPVILIIDEFDALQEDFINKFANEFRDMYMIRQNESGKKSAEKKCLLHALALVGVRSVLGIENVTGSPFNVQRNIHIPGLSFSEVNYLFKWYERESGQNIEQGVIDRIFAEFNGHPGLTCWFGELLTETPNSSKSEHTISTDQFVEVYSKATNILPNNTILNIISKAKTEPFKTFVLEMFRTDEKIPFRYDNPNINFLYLNGVICQQKSGTQYFVRFSSPYVQKRLFNYFSDDMFSYMGKLVAPFERMEELVTEKRIHIKNVLKRYEIYLKENRSWLLKNAPKRKDLRIFEAVYHFNLFMYLHKFLTTKNAEVYPEFPTGNGKIDIIIKYADKTYGLELKSYTDERGYENALSQAAHYGKQLGLSEITIVFFIEYIDTKNRDKYERIFSDTHTGVNVLIVFVETGK